MSEAEKVLCSFYFCELILSFACLVIHVMGFLDTSEPLPHNMIFCGTFFAFTIVTAFEIIGFFLKVQMNYILELIITVVGTGMFLTTSIFSMYIVEQDEHLLYLTDAEELEHKFLYMNRSQSILSLAAALTFLMHTYILIFMLLPKPQADCEDDAPLELHFFCGDIAYWVLSWFMNIERERPVETQVEVFTITKHEMPLEVGKEMTTVSIQELPVGKETAAVSIPELSVEREMETVSIRELPMEEEPATVSIRELLIEEETATVSIRELPQESGTEREMSTNTTQESPEESEVKKENV